MIYEKPLLAVFNLDKLNDLLSAGFDKLKVNAVIVLTPPPHGANNDVDKCRKYLFSTFYLPGK